MLTRPIEGSIREVLGEDYGVYPMSVVYSPTVIRGGLLRLTFRIGLQEFLGKVLGYSSLADKTGIGIWPKTGTVVITGIALRVLIRKLSDNEEHRDNTGLART